MGSRTQGLVPNITGFINGEINFLHNGPGTYGGVFYPTDFYTYQTANNYSTQHNQARQLNFDASRGSSRYVADVDFVRPMSVAIAFIIKY